MVNNFCDCRKRIEHLLRESLDDTTEIQSDYEEGIDNSMECLLKKIKIEVLGVLRKDLKIIIENKFKDTLKAFDNFKSKQQK